MGAHGSVDAASKAGAIAVARALRAELARRTRARGRVSAAVGAARMMQAHG